MNSDQNNQDKLERDSKQIEELIKQVENELRLISILRELSKIAFQSEDTVLIKFENWYVENTNGDKFQPLLKSIIYLLKGKRLRDFYEIVLQAEGIDEIGIDNSEITQLIKDIKLKQIDFNILQMQISSIMKDLQSEKKELENRPI